MEVRKNKRGNIKLKLTPAEEKAMYEEIEDQLLEFVAKNLLEIEAMILWQLREQLGFGHKRLDRFYNNMDSTIYDLLVHEIKYHPDHKPKTNVEKLLNYGLNIEEMAKIRDDSRKEDTTNEIRSNC